MATATLTETAIRDWVRRKLGGNTVDLEIRPDDYTDALQEAVEKYFKHKPLRIIKTYNQPADSSTIIPPDGCKGLSNCRIVRETELSPLRSLDGGGLFAPMGVRVFAPTSVDLHTVELSQKWLDLTGRILGSDPDWYYDYYTDELKIVSPGTSCKVTVDWLQPGLYPDDLERVPQTDHDWIKRYTLAAVKEPLGRARSKYDAVPVAGTTLQMDGERLLTESKEEREALIEELKNSSATLFPRWG